MTDDKGPIGLVTLVCLTCGNEKFFDQVRALRIEVRQVRRRPCSGIMRRPTEPDDASIAQLEEQARSISYGDSSPDTTPGDVRDLDAR